MFPKQSHILAPLTAQSGAKGNKINWTPECQKSFEQMKALMVQEVFLWYPDHNKPFHIYADASDFQLGATIFQDSTCLSPSIQESLTKLNATTPQVKRSYSPLWKP
jgi:RNase H-like domain found in reverse transcriptase